MRAAGRRWSLAGICPEERSRIFATRPQCLPETRAGSLQESETAEIERVLPADSATAFCRTGSRACAASSDRLNTGRLQKLTSSARGTTCRAAVATFSAASGFGEQFCIAVRSGTRVSAMNQSPLTPDHDAPPKAAENHRNCHAANPSRWMHWTRRIAKLPGIFAILLVRAYQWTISPLLGRTCRFHPSCSQYFILAVQKYGLLRGLWKGTHRICRCHPWNPGGLDPP